MASGLCLHRARTFLHYFQSSRTSWCKYQTLIKAHHRKKTCVSCHSVLTLRNKTVNSVTNNKQYTIPCTDRPLKRGLTTQVTHEELEKTESFLYTGGSETLSPVVELDLNLDDVVRNSDQLRRNLKYRQLDIDVENFIRNYNKYKELKEKKNALEKEKDEITEVIKLLVKEKSPEAKKEKDFLISKGKEIKKELTDVLRPFRVLEKDVMLQALSLPNGLHESTPKSTVEVERYGTIPEISSPKTHMDIGESDGTLRFYHISPGAYYMKGNLSLLEFELCNYLDDFMDDHRFQLFTGPDTVKSIVMEACGEDFQNPDKVFTLQRKPGADDDVDEVTMGTHQHLCGTSPMVFMAYMMKMNMSEDCFPIRWYSVGTSYSPDVLGTTENFGLLGAPQKKQLELFGAATSHKEAEGLYWEFIDVVTTLYNQINLPFRVVQVGASELRRREMCRMDFQLWFPGFREFYTVGEVSLWGDHVSRRLMSKFSYDVNQVIPQNNTYTCHASGVNVTRLLAAAIECNQTTNLTLDMLTNKT